ncbi:acetyltransferase [Streptomyces sp. NPDC020490]|uniref:acetyltransferase n=1 Tax=Streptomyces sp. NPDC020490 TaxID=3365078 RepID=UPI0037991673
MPRRKLRSAAVITAVAAAGLIGTAVPASAAAASPTAVCGSGYSVIDSQGLSTAATVYLLYSSSTGKNCVVTIRDSSGTAAYMEASIRKSGGSWVSDAGNYSSYAGPVYVSAAGTCIQWEGMFGQGYYQSGWEHCG